MKLTASYHHALSRLIGCCFFMLIALGVKAQTRGTVEVVQDPRIDTLLARRMQPAKAHTVAGGVAPVSATTPAIATDGYRVQLYSGGNRAEAYAAQDKFKQRFPNLRTYISYSQPNFKVHAGDFRSRMEASKLMQQMRPYFPVLFIIGEKINPPLNDPN